MCLFIKEVPLSKNHRNLVPCWKVVTLESYYYYNCYRTPYQYTKIPSDGVLFVNNSTHKSIVKYDPNYYDQWRGVIEGGAIHAFVSRTAALDCCGRGCGWGGLRENKKAYAFGVIAYGTHRDLCATMVYIPSLDKSKDKKVRMEKIRGWENAGKLPSDKEVKALFPAYVKPY